MPNSFKTHTTDGTTTLFSFAEIDGWVSTGFIKVYLDGVLQTTGYSLVDLTTSTPKVQFTTAPAASKVLLISRETPSTVSSFQNNIVDFNNGSVLTEADLDNLAKGLLHVAQEAKDAGANSLGLAADGTWNAASRRIANVSSPIGPYDAVNKLYLDGYDLTGTGWTVPQSWTFTGNGSTTSFTWSSVGGPAPATTDAAMFIVEVGGVIQRPGASPNGDYTITTNAITFSEAPDNTVGIRVRNFGVARDIPVWGSPITFSGNVTVDGTTTLSEVVIQGDIGIGRGGLGDSNSVYVGEVPTSGAGVNITGVGANIFTQLTSGADNVAMGTNAASGNTNGDRNTNIGYNSVGNAGSHNTAVGANAGNGVSSVTTNQSVYIGSAATASGNVTNEIVIGYNATGDGSNTTVIGNSNTTQTKTRGNLVSTGSITSTGAMVANGNLSSTGTLSVTGAGTSSISGTLNVPAITGLNSFSASTLSGTTINGTNITATNSVTAANFLNVGNATLSSPSGTAPMFVPRAWVNFNGLNDATYGGRNTVVAQFTKPGVAGASGGRIITVTNWNSHGFQAGHMIYASFSGAGILGTTISGAFLITEIVSTSSFRFLDDINPGVAVGFTASGNITVPRATMQSWGNVSSVIEISGESGVYAINLTTALPNTTYAVFGTSSTGAPASNTAIQNIASVSEAFTDQLLATPLIVDRRVRKSTNCIAIATTAGSGTTGGSGPRSCSVMIMSI